MGTFGERFREDWIRLAGEPGIQRLTICNTAPETWAEVNVPNGPNREIHELEVGKTGHKVGMHPSPQFVHMYLEYRLDWHSG